MAQAILQALHELSQELGIQIVAPEYEILVALLDTTGMTPEQLREESSLSRSGFFHAVDRLKHWQLIECTTSTEDRRRKIYRLRPRTAAMMIGNLNLFRRSMSSFAVSSLRRRGGDGMSGSEWDGTAEERLTMPLPNLTPEYQVLLFLYLEPGSTNGQIGGAIAASPTRFQATLGRLTALGLVTRMEDGVDKRRKHYALEPRVSEAIAGATERVMDWLDRVASEVAAHAPANQQPRQARAG